MEEVHSDGALMADSPLHAIASLVVTADPESTESLEVLRRALMDGSMADGLDEAEVRQVWKEVAGEFIGRHSEPASVRDGVLVLRVSQPTMKFHLEQMKPLLLERIRERLGRDRIKAIRFTHG